MKIAYAAALINLATGAVEYGVFSDWPLERRGDYPVIHALIATAQGSTFDSAYRRVVRQHDVAKLVMMGHVPAAPTPPNGVLATPYLPATGQHRV